MYKIKFNSYDKNLRIQKFEVTRKDCRQYALKKFDINLNVFL